MTESPDLYAVAQKEMGERGDPAVRYWLSTGCLGLDLSISRGLPGGRTVELFGPKASYKSGLALSICRQAQLAGGTAIWVDLEGRLHESLAVKYHDIDLNHGWIYYDADDAGNPISIESCLNFLRKVAIACQDSTVPVVYVVDSVAAFFSEDQTPDMDEKHQNMLVAKKLSTWFSYGFNQLIKNTNFYPIFINQTRAKVSFFKYGPPEDTTPGGRALEFYSSTRIQMTASSLTKREDPSAKDDSAGKIIGRMIKAYVEKNSVGPPFRSALFPFYFYEQAESIIGMDDYLSQLNYLISRKALPPGLTKKGTPRKGYYEIGGVSNSKLGWRRRMIEEPEVASIVYDKVCEQFVKDHT